MANDILLQFTDIDEADLVLGNGDLERDGGLGTAVLLSLFSDRRADIDDEYDNDDRKGWWGDNIAETEGDQIGSKIWLLSRSKATQENIEKLQLYAFEALEWMIEDEVVTKIETEAYSYGLASNKRVALIIKIYKSDENVVSIKFDDVWNETPVLGV